MYYRILRLEKVGVKCGLIVSARDRGHGCLHCCACIGNMPNDVKNDYLAKKKNISLYLKLMKLHFMHL